MALFFLPAYWSNPPACRRLQGYRTFRERRKDRCYYVDKIPFALQMIEQGKYCFLSRPQRFGKSLFLDTLKELFEGNEPLFCGLYIHKKWDWSILYRSSGGYYVQWQGLVVVRNLKAAETSS